MEVTLLARSRSGLLLVATFGAMTALSSPPNLAKPLEGRLRAGYMGTGYMKVLPEMSKAGMNAALVGFGNIAGPDVASYAATMRPMSEATAGATTVRELAETVVSLHGARLDVEYQPPRPGDILHSQADSGRAATLLGFDARWMLREGLREMIQGRAPTPADGTRG